MKVEVNGMGDGWKKTWKEIVNGGGGDDDNIDNFHDYIDNTGENEVEEEVVTSGAERTFELLINID